MTEDLQPILDILHTQQIAKAHECALRENKTRISDWATIGEGQEAWLTGISRGFGGDNAFYEDKSPQHRAITVCVSWAAPFIDTGAYGTTVLIDDEVVAEFNDLEYIQPHVALARLGYVVHGTVDFAQVFSLK